MIVPDRKTSWFRLLFTMRGSTIPRIRGRLLAVFSVAVLVTVAHEYFGLATATDLTITPFTLISLALGVFLGFRNNTAYDRFWEGRRLWGRLVNDSRSFARMVLTLISHDALPTPSASLESVRALQVELIYRMIGYAQALRMHLRNDLGDLRPLEPFLPKAEVAPLALERNIPNALLLRMGERIADARRMGVVRHRDILLFETLLNDLTDVQGGCERIKGTPMPWSYTVLIHSIVASYCFALPFGLVNTIGRLTPVVVVMIAYAFLGLDAVGDEIEEPFGTDYNDLPLTTLSRMIEVNLRQMLGETELPRLIEPDVRGVLL